MIWNLCTNEVVNLGRADLWLEAEKHLSMGKASPLPSYILENSKLLSVEIDLTLEKLILKGFLVDDTCSVSFLGCANVQIVVASNK